MSSAGAVLIEGPKACGKTATATRVAGSVIGLDVDTAADALLRFDDKVDTSKFGSPVFTGVVTTRSPAYRRSDGVLVIPIATFGP